MARMRESVISRCWKLFPSRAKPRKLMEQEGYTLELTFDLGVGANVDVVVMSYVDGRWVEVKAVNNGDGTVTYEVVGTDIAHWGQADCYQIGKNVGDYLDFGGLLGRAPVMEIRDYGTSELINRGGRVPAPIHSNKN